MIRTLAVTALMLALPLAVIACGGGPPGPATGPAPVTVEVPTLPTIPLPAATAPEPAEATPTVVSSTRSYPPPAEDTLPAPTGTMGRLTLPAEVTAPAPEATAESAAPDAAAIVNGRVIPLADYQKELIGLRTTLISQGEIDPNTEEGQQRLATLGQQVLEGLITNVLIEQAAERLGVTVSEKDVQTAFQAMVNDLGGEQAVQELLASEGMTVEQYLEQQRALLLAQALRARIVGEVGERGEQIHVRHIMVKTEAEAQQALARVRAGEDFAKVAREMSQDAATADKGGDLGWFPRGIMPPEFDEVAFSLEPGGISHIVEVPPGYHIIQVLERDPDCPLSDEHWQTLMEKGTQKFYDWLAQERANADVRILIDQ